MDTNIDIVSTVPQRSNNLSKRLIVVAAIAAVTFVAALFSAGLTLA